MPKLKINGKEVDVAPGTNVLKACLDNGAYVPHFCWHPGLKAAGNCRMCLVKTSTSRKLEVSCMMACADKMEIETEAPEVVKARRDVLEFLLINHPLDCPVCDKAGECDLQDFTYTYRNGLSRFVDEKNIRHTKDLGPDIKIWGNRCIVCTRCVRFCDEVAGTGELCVVNRGDHSVVDVFPGIPIDNPLSLNVVDICPVGALIDKNFLYKARVWFAKETPTTCVKCSRGCNVAVTALDNDIKRITPRFNAEVNGHWMCDEGRLNNTYLKSERRLKTARGGAAAAARGLGFAGAAIVVSTYQTVEEMYLVKLLAEAVRAKVGILTHRRGDRWTAKNGFTIEPDKTPNAAFAAALWGEKAVETSYREVLAGIFGGTYKSLLWINGIPARAWSEDAESALGRVESLAVMDVQEWPGYDRAQAVLPAAAWAEKDGVVMNFQGRLQRLKKAIDAPAGARPESEWLQEILVALGKRETVLSSAGVFKEAAKAVPALSGFDYAGVKA